ncbi:MAG: GAF domain-containing protein [Bacteroidia bacterium]|nr:GAF domain-containing protein [Bacteroidia bacterium]
MRSAEDIHQTLNTLNEIGRKITSSLSVEVINDTVYENVNSLMDAAGFGIGFVDVDAGQLVFPGYIEKGEKLPEARYNLNDRGRLAVVCLNDDKDILINDFYTEINQYVTSAKTPAVGEQTLSIIYLPLKTKNKTIGVITVQSFKKNAFTQYDQMLLKNMAVYTAIALENAGIYRSIESEVKKRTEEIEQNYRNTRLLSEIGQQFTSALDFNVILHKIYENVNMLMPAECFGIRIYHPAMNTVEYKFEVENGHEYEPVMVPMDDDDNYTVRCIKDKKVIFINDNLNEYHHYVKQIKVVSGDMPHSLIFFPLVLENRVVGVITVQSFKKHAYTPYHISILQTLGTYAAIALENASLYNHLEEKVNERTAEVVRQKEIIQEKSKEINDSISYARHLQNALLPANEQINDPFPDSFILYRPRNVVSGDFYWYSRRSNKHLIAAADCTGHGVPGAFMSMMSIDRLNQAILDISISRPGDILSLVNMGIKDTLRQDEEEAVSRDGMDICLAAIDAPAMKLEYAGANRPLWIVRDGQLLEFRPTKHAIGGTTSLTQEFETHTIDLQKGDCVYLHTDGYADQFGGEKGKKLMTRNFKDLVLAAAHKPMSDQLTVLESSLGVWMGDFEQVDDILVIGLRIP